MPKLRRRILKYFFKLFFGERLRFRRENHDNIASRRNDFLKRRFCLSLPEISLNRALIHRLPNNNAYPFFLFSRFDHEIWCGHRPSSFRCPRVRHPKVPTDAFLSPSGVRELAGRPVSRVA